MSTKNNPGKYDCLAKGASDMSTIDTHALNKLLATVAGKNVYEQTFNKATVPTGKESFWFIKDSTKWHTDYALEGDEVWDPCHNANQMELIEEQLIRQGHEIHYAYGEMWGAEKDQWHVSVGRHLPNEDFVMQNRTHESKKIALALAIKAMEEAKTPATPPPDYSSPPVP